MSSELLITLWVLSGLLSWIPDRIVVAQFKREDPEGFAQAVYDVDGPTESWIESLILSVGFGPLGIPMAIVQVWHLISSARAR